MLNRRGHLATTMMFFITLILIVSALFSFSNFNSEVGEKQEVLNNLIFEFNFRQKFVPIVFGEMIGEAIEQAERDGNFEEVFESSLKEIAERRRDPEISNLFAELIEKEINLEKLDDENEKYRLLVKDVFVKFSEGKNEMNEEFNLVAEIEKKEDSWKIKIDKDFEIDGEFD
jgi:hypothetical protein